MPLYEKGCLCDRSFGELIHEMLNAPLSHQRLHPVIKEQQIQYFDLRKICQKNDVAAHGVDRHQFRRHFSGNIHWRRRVKYSWVRWQLPLRRAPILPLEGGGKSHPPQLEGVYYLWLWICDGKPKALPRLVGTDACQQLRFLLAGCQQMFVFPPTMINFNLNNIKTRM